MKRTRRTAEVAPMNVAGGKMSEQPDTALLAGQTTTAPGTGHASGQVFARWVSLVVHPVAFPIVTLAALLYSATHSLPQTGRWLLFALVLTSLPVTALVVYKVARGHWTDLDVSVRRQRYLLYPFGLACLASLALVYTLLQAPVVAIAATVSSVVANVVDGVINFRYKVSAHATSAAAC